MKRLFLTLLVAVSFLSVYGFPVDTVRINRTFAAMVESGYTAETQRDFFDAFPKTWHEYWLTYGNIPAFDNLQSSFRSHMVEGLYKLDQIPDSLFYDRLISLGIAGTVEADDVGHDLQDLIRRELKKNPRLMMERLSKRYYTSYFPFWYFVFNSLICHPIHVDLYGMLKDPEWEFAGKYPTIMSYMDQAFALSCGKARFMEELFPSYADEVKNDIKMLESFYSKYITNILENKLKANKELKEAYFLPALIGQIEEMNEHSGADNVIRAQDASRDMLNTLRVSSLGNNWYQVSWRYEEIPVKVAHHNGKRLIEYIIPETLGNKYGDEYIK